MATLRSNQGFFFFDIETGGKEARASSILSLSYAQGSSDPVPLYADPVRGTRLYRWAEKNVWDKIKGLTAGGTEEQLIKNFIHQVDSLPAGSTLAGWNIGYLASRQGPNVPGFDLPFLTTRASQYGLEDKLRSAVGRHTIRDLGHEHSLRIAREVVRRGEPLVHAGIMHADLHEQAVGYMKKAAQVAHDYGVDPTDVEATARVMGRSGNKYMFSGWKQEDIYKLVTGQTLAGAHQSQFDVAALQRLRSFNIDDDFLKRWSRVALENKLISGAVSKPYVDDSLRYYNALKTASEMEGAHPGIRRAVEKGIHERIVASGGSFLDVEKGLGISETYRNVGSFLGGRGGSRFNREALTGILRRHPVSIGLGAAIGLAYATQIGQYFSGKDDEYNVIEGLPHKGMAGALRRQNTDFGSGYQGDQSENKWLPFGLAVGAGWGFRTSTDFINKPIDITTYQEQFTKFQYRPGDIITSRNVLYDDVFHTAIVGADKNVYQVYPGERGVAKITRESIPEYVAGQLKVHRPEGMRYPMTGVLRADLDSRQKQALDDYLSGVFKQHAAGKYTPKYGLGANKAVHEINCLSFASEAYKRTGQDLIRQGSTGAVPWNLELGNFQQVLRGPTAISNYNLGKLTAVAGLAGIGAGVVNNDLSTIGYGVGAVGLSAAMPWLSSSTASKILPLAGLPLPATAKKYFRPFASTAIGAAIAYPALAASYDAVTGSDEGIDTNLAAKVLTGGSVAALGVAGYQALQPGVQYNEKSKKLLILADAAKGGAQGHMTPSIAMQGWLRKHGWDADIVEGLDDLSKLRKQQSSYRAFVDAGYNAQWVHGLPGISMQWDVSQGMVDSGQFRSHLRPWLGLQSEGMVYALPSEAQAKGFNTLVGNNAFYSLDALAIRPDVIERVKGIQRELRNNSLELPFMKKGERFVTISGGGKGFGVPEVTDVLARSGWLEKTDQKAVIFGAHLKKHRPKEYAHLQRLAAENPRLLLFDLAEGGPGRMLPQYMAASNVNILAGGASTAVEAALAGKPFLGITGAGLPNWGHFRGNVEFAAQRWGAITDIFDLPHIGQATAAQQDELSAKLTGLLDEGRLNRRDLTIASGDLDVGRRLIDIVETAESRGQLKPSRFRPTIQNLIFPLMASSQFKNVAKIAGITGALGIAYNFFSGDDDDHNTIEGLRHEGMAGKLRRENTAFGSGFDALRGFVKAGETFQSMLKSRKFQQALSSATAVEELGRGAYGVATKMRGTFRGQEFFFVRKTGDVTRREIAAMRQLGSDNVTPTLYRSKGVFRRSIDMELMEGTTLSALSAAELGSISIADAVKAARSKMLQAGIIHGDLHAKNLMLVPTASGKAEIGVIDLGIARQSHKLSASAYHDALTQDTIKMNRTISGIQGKLQVERQVAALEAKQSIRGRIPVSNRFSGKDDAYNTIEGLRHEGMAGSMRQRNTDFGSGWARNLISKGSQLFRRTPKPVIHGPSNVVTSSEGTQFVYESMLGRGGFGSAYLMRNVETGQRVVYKELADAKGLDRLLRNRRSVLIPRSSRVWMKQGPAGEEKAFDFGATIAKAQRKEYTKRVGWFQRKYKSPIEYEAAMQRAAHAENPDLVPKVVGETKTGFFQEFSGRPLGTVEDLEGVSAHFKSMYGKMTSGQASVIHFDPDISNVIRTESGQFKMIDFGQAAPAHSLNQNQKFLNQYQDLIETSIKKADAKAAQLRKLTEVNRQQAIEIAERQKAAMLAAAGPVEKTAIGSKINKTQQAAAQRQGTEVAWQAGVSGGRKSKIGTAII